MFYNKVNNREYCNQFLNKLFEFDKNCYKYQQEDGFDLLKCVIRCGLDITEKMINDENINRKSIFDFYGAGLRFEEIPLSLAIRRGGF